MEEIVTMFNCIILPLIFGPKSIQIFKIFEDNLVYSAAAAGLLLMKSKFSYLEVTIKSAITRVLK